MSTHPGLRRIERLAGRMRHSRMLGTLDPMWDRIRPAYNRFLRVAGGGAVLRRINGEDPVALLVQHREIPDEWEPGVWRDLMASLQPGDVFVDVGAHIGLYTVAAARRVGPTGKVHAFEADPTTVRSLAAHARMNGVDDIVRVHPLAVGDHTGTIPYDARGNSQSAVVPADGLGETYVALTTLDGALRGVAVSVIKIDVEGYELQVLRGAGGLLADTVRAPRAIYVEMHPYAWPGHGVAFEDVRDLLESFDYRLRHLDGTPVTTVDTWSEIVAERVPG